MVTTTRWRRSCPDEGRTDRVFKTTIFSVPLDVEYVSRPALVAFVRRDHGIADGDKDDAWVAHSLKGPGRVVFYTREARDKAEAT